MKNLTVEPELRLVREDIHSFLKEHVFSVDPTSVSYPGRVGLELEMLAIRLGDDAHPQASQQRGIDILQGWVENQSGKIQRDASGVFLGAQFSDGSHLSFEPGGQVELSTSPSLTLTEASQRLSNLQDSIAQVLQTNHFQLTQIGVNPWHTIEELGLVMNKPRYQAMDQYFGSEPGRRMMRQTMSGQICLDLGTDQQLMKRYLASQMLAPLLGAMFCYSPFEGGRAQGDKLSLRIEAWRNMDAGRTGFPPFAKDLDAITLEDGIESYVQFVLACPVVFVEALDYWVPPRRVTFHEWMSRGLRGVFPTLRDLKTHLSLLFPEVRPRGYLELRSVDAQSRVWQMVPPAIAVGCLYDEITLDEILSQKELWLQRHELLQASVYGLKDPTLARWTKIMAEKALEGLARLPDDFCTPSLRRRIAHYVERFTERGRVPAQDLLDMWQKRGHPTLWWSDLMTLEADWNDYVNSL